MTLGDQMLNVWSGPRGLVIAGCLLAAACINIDPAREGAGDAGIDATGGEDLIQACAACLTSPDHPDPTCADTYATCAANETCIALHNCVVASGCHPYADLQAFYACAWPCADQYGVTLFDDVYNIAMPVAFCVTGACEAECSIPPE
jgi:hypothetical protein